MRKRGLSFLNFLFVLIFASPTLAASTISAPTLKTASAGDRQATLTWSAVSDAKNYDVLYGINSGAYTTTLNLGNVTTYAVPGLTNGTKYYFVVRAKNGPKVSVNSNQLNATPQAPVVIPSAPTLNNASAGNGQVTLSWNSVSNATGYKVKYATSSGNYTTVVDVGNVTSYNVTNLTNGTTYYFAVVAYNSAGTSGNSNEVSATPNFVETATLFVKNVDYNAAGQIIKIEYGNGVTTTYTYDPLNLRLKKIYTVNSSVTVLQNLNYAYDSVGNIVSIADNVNTASQTFNYDELNRLKSASGSYGTKNYSYDKIGNITQKDGINYTYGLGGLKPHAVTALNNGTTFEYDANGNMSKRTEPGNVITTYTYDTENRLTRVDKNGNNLALYYYDGDGGRQKTIVGGGITTHVGNLYEESGTRKTKYVFLGNTRIASLTNGNVLYYHGDHLGSANVLTDASGVKKELTEYEPFGKISRSNKLGNSDEIARYYFTGQKLDDETGLYFYNARYYDPSLGRFITADTLTPNPKNSQAFNHYAYVFNNPLKYTDPSGNFPWIAAIIGAIIGGASGGISAYNSGQPLWQGVLLGGIQGFFSGAVLGTPFSSIKEQGYWWGLTQASGGLSLAGQLAGAVGWREGQRTLGYAALGTGALYMGVNILKGIKDWLYEDRFNTYDTTFEEPVYVQSGDRVHVNGVVSDLKEAIVEAKSAPFKANVLANNPTSGPIADLTEAFFDKLTFTSSVSRQLGRSLSGLSNISLSGFSQGGIIASNTTLQLGLMDQRNVVSQLRVGSTQISQIRVLLSGGIGAGLSRGQITYGAGSMWDFSNFLGPNLNLKYFAGGAVGTAFLPFVGMPNHHPPTF